MDRIAVAHGDGIGPEIMNATLYILKEANAKLSINEVEIGEKLYLKGIKTGIEDSTWNIIRNSKAFLKAPITTPQGGGFKSLNVTVRTTMGLYANVRPCVSYAPFVKTKHPNMDVVIVRENEEDLYTGIEYKQTANIAHSLKMISREGSERIIQFAFEYALANGRKKVTCFTKDNIMKFSDGLFHEVFNEIAKEYPNIISEHWIVDIGAAKLADTPQDFDVIVMPNLYGDILSDVAAQISGSVGLAGSANIGTHGAMFEAIHGSAPRRAGQNVANPSGLLLAAIQMLGYLGQNEVADTIHNAWLKTIEEGIHTYDIYKEDTSREKVGTKEFAQAVVARLGQKPHTLKAVSSKKIISKERSKNFSELKKEVVGADFFIAHHGNVHELHKKLCDELHLKLTKIYNRGVEVWPTMHPETACVEEWRLRYLSQQPIEPNEIFDFAKKMSEKKIEILKIETLCHFDGKPGYSN